jgi:hypothetical protein
VARKYILRNACTMDCNFLSVQPYVWQQSMITFFSILGLVCKQDIEHNKTGLVMQQKKGLLSKHWTWFLQALDNPCLHFFGCVDDGWYTCFFWVHELSIVYKVVVTPLKLSLWLWPQNETPSILLATSGIKNTRMRIMQINERKTSAV